MDESLHMDERPRRGAMRHAALGLVAPAVLAATLGGCARRGPPGVPPGAPAMVDTRRGPGLPPATTPASADADDPALDALAARAASLAPGMREEVRIETPGARLPVPLLRADKADACARVAFAAPSAGRAWLEDAKGAVLAETSGRSGALGPRGPVCIRRGDTITLRFEGADVSRLRVVAWVSP